MELDTPLSELFRIKKDQKAALGRLSITTVAELLYYFPLRYSEKQTLSYISEVQSGDQVIIHAEVKRIHARKSWQSKINMTEAILEEPGGTTIKAIWFSQPYISKMLAVGTVARFSGTVNERNGVLALTNPEFERTKTIPLEQTGALFGEDVALVDQTLYPVYRETKGVSSKWLYHHITALITRGVLDDIQDPIPDDVRAAYSLPTLAHALVYIHSPKKQSDAKAARKRFAFEEIFFAQLVRQSERKEYEQSGAFALNSDTADLDQFTANLPYRLTGAQERAIASIRTDMAREVPMSRLIEGDVGSGKTIVAAAAALLAVQETPRGQNFGHLQVAYMAPTEILAKQIFNDFCELFASYNIQIGLLTSKDCRKFPSKTDGDATAISRRQLGRWVENGEIHILVGTHALIAKNVYFENLGLVIIDEQHRFGKKQRALLRNKGREKAQSKAQKVNHSKIQKKGLGANDEIIPHLLSMSATPIPRTLALTIYGDLDLTVLDELPAGRKPIKTHIVGPTGRAEMYEAVRREITNGRQAYVICPRINENEPDAEHATQMRSAVGEAERLAREVFPDLAIGVMHSKLKKDEKDQVMQEFATGRYDILVATSVVEVGVNVPNATSIIIEGAERFGLAQLHQLRGRVMRSSHQPYCYICSESVTAKAQERLRILSTAADGFELAEADLQLRGSGEMLGNKQSGLSDLAMEALANLKLVEAARSEAVRIIKQGTLDAHPAMHAKFARLQQVVYME